jgi:hypothetical protein
MLTKKRIHLLSIHAGLSSVKSIYDAVVLFLVFYHATKFFEASQERSVFGHGLHAS